MESLMPFAYGRNGNPSSPDTRSKPSFSERWKAKHGNTTPKAALSFIPRATGQQANLSTDHQNRLRKQRGGYFRA